MALAKTYDYGSLPELLTLLTGDEKHQPSTLSTLDVLWVLYDRVLNVDPRAPGDPERDRFLLSKGHGPAAYYAVLAAKGFFPVGVLESFGAFESPLGYHPDRKLVAGVEISSGSLGHGLPIAVGTVLALDAQRLAGPCVVCLVGDGELDEGSSFEAIQLAGRLGLGRLTAAVIDNGSATYGWPGGIETRFAQEGWTTAVVAGREHRALERAFAAASAEAPHAVVARVEVAG